MNINDKLSYGDESPIAALATAVTVSALAVIRLSGKGTIELLSRVFSRPSILKNAAGNTVVYGWITAPEKIDEVLVSVYRAPRSYTGEESADLSCHGGISAVQDIMAALLRSGFREALPGEFTFRAFINGKLDLTRAESVMELVAAKTGAARANAVERLFGALETKIRMIKEQIVTVLAEVELNLDYSEDDGIVAENERLPACDNLKNALELLRELAGGYACEKLYRDGAHVVLAGPPNAGKSSLFNLLLREERSIVTHIPGTTRDWIEAWISIKGIPVCIIDTAGLRDSGDDIEKIGIEKSRHLIHSADLVVFMIDGTNYNGVIPVELKNFDKNKIIFVWNKTDIVQNPKNSGFFSLSVKTEQGIVELINLISLKIENLYQKNKKDDVGLGSDRQKILVDTAVAALQNTLDMAENGQPLDIISVELHAAVRALGEITGEVSTGDLLEIMFSRFCVGK
ncbi:MAG: tRNA uridine-5-carboxymethylaminomethyl(34) synthesis GTPase MnmE [Spirochaetaceae bacterium]|jgi:tRNA modification GTPase|nr:tRNA uridine-5-carboxymethylaminomethyl(34) synthesis GTPase MnmE [Spirochaetaceae bacterium]